MTDSAQQLQIRILTGMHAGAEITLGHGGHEIGFDPECDVVISDWPYSRSLFNIEVSEDGALQCVFADEALAIPFGLNVPRQVGAIAFVATDPAEPARESDLALLTQMLTPPAPPAKARKRISVWLVVTMFATIATVSGIALQSSGSVAATKVVKPVAAVPIEQVRTTLRMLKYPNIRAVKVGGKIVVTGMVQTHAEYQKLAAQLNALDISEIEQRYAVESEIAAAISDAMGQPGLAVKHAGGGVFEVTGNVPRNVVEKIDLARIKSDLGPIVSVINYTNLKEVAKNKESEEQQLSHGYRVRQSADGAKYFSLPEQMPSFLE